MIQIETELANKVLKLKICLDFYLNDIITSFKSKLELDFEKLFYLLLFQNFLISFISQSKSAHESTMNRKIAWVFFCAVFSQMVNC